MEKKPIKVIKSVNALINFIFASRLVYLWLITREIIFTDSECYIWENQMDLCITFLGFFSFVSFVFSFIEDIK